MRSGLSRVLQLFSTYDEWRYWNSRADPNASKGWEEERLRYDTAYIRSRLHGCERILELGPGVGRTFGAHSPEARITCYDITENYRRRLLERAKDLNLKVTHEVARSLDAPLPYGKAAFDAAVASQVLQHQRPERIERVMAELVRVAEKVVAIASWGKKSGRGRSRHAFNHDYVEICAEIGCEMNHVRLNDGTIYFVCNRI